MVTHDPHGASYADRVVFLADGNVVDELRAAHGRLGAGADADAWVPDMWRVTIKGLLAHKLRLALTAMAIVLGVTFIAGTFVLTDTLNNTFKTLFGNVYQNVDFQVRGVAQFGTRRHRHPQPHPRVDLLATVRGVPGVEAADGIGRRATPSTSATTARRISTGGAPTLGVSFDPESQLSPAPPRRRARPRRRPHDVVMDARHGAEVRLQGGPAGPHPAARADADLHHHRPRPLRDGGQPGRRHPGRLQCPDGATALGRGGPIRRHQCRGGARRQQGGACSGTSRSRCHAAWRW